MAGKDPYEELPRYGPPVDLVSTMQQSLIVTDANVSGGASINPLKLGRSPAVIAYRSTAQSIGNASFTTLLLDSASYDPFSMNSNGTITVPAPGVYAVWGRVSLASNNVGERILAIGNSLSVATFNYVSDNANASDHHGMEASTLVHAAPGAKFQLNVFQNSGGSLNTILDVDATQGHATLAVWLVST